MRSHMLSLSPSFSHFPLDPHHHLWITKRIVVLAATTQPHRRQIRISQPRRRSTASRCAHCLALPSNAYVALPVPPVLHAALPLVPAPPLHYMSFCARVEPAVGMHHRRRPAWKWQCGSGARGTHMRVVTPRRRPRSHVRTVVARSTDGATPCELRPSTPLPHPMSVVPVNLLFLGRDGVG
jgi:hypothetical protein